MAAKTRTLTFNGNNITFLRWGKHWVLPAKLLGQALGYSGNGDKLATLISGGWKPEFQYMAISGVLAIPKETHKVDAMLLASSALSTFKTAAGQTTTAPRMLVLTMSGVIRVLGKSRAKMASAFRDFLATNGGELLDGFELPPSQGGSRAELAIPSKDVTPIEGLIKVAEMMSKNKLISKRDKKTYLKKVAEVALVDYQKRAGLTNFVKDPKTPPTETKALAKNAMSVPEGNFNVVSTENPYHPDFLNWKPASDIGSEWLLKGDQVKKYAKKFCDDRKIPLPNNEAKAFVDANGGNFPKPDDKGFIIYKPSHGFGIALYMQMGGNQMNWRNYWSPTAVQDIRDLIVIDKGAPVLNLVEMVKVNIASNIFDEIDTMGHSMRLDSAETKYRDECRKKNVQFSTDKDFMKDFLDGKSVEGGPLTRWRNLVEPKMMLYTKKTDTQIDEKVWERSTPMDLSKSEEIEFIDPNMNFEKDRTALPEGAESTMFGGGNSSNPPSRPGEA